MNNQHRQEENRILSLLMSYGKGSDEPLIVNAELLLGCSGIAGERFKATTDRMVQQGLLTIYDGSYLVTTDGLRRYEEDSSNPEIPESLNAWKNEVLSGSRVGKSENGHTTLLQTSIKDAALPGPPERENPPTPEEMIGRSQEQARAMKRAAKKLGLSPAKFRELFNEGRIRECCVGTDQQHTGIFDKSGKGKTGRQYWKSKCRACLKGRVE
jgi:hypothetical protein